MELDNILPLRMNAFWFTYTSVVLSTFTHNFIDLGLIEIIGISTAVVVLENLWSLYRGRPIMDERKQRLVTSGMAWSYIVVTVALVLAVTANLAINSELIREIASLGLWTFIMYLCLKILYQDLGGEK